jgi:hypothetical protein
MGFCEYGETAGRQKKTMDMGVFWVFSDGVWIPFALQGKPLTSVQPASFAPFFVIIITSKP